jgi:endonuclease/exonuclease/phosphatase family metal-dependent hydrolase
VNRTGTFDLLEGQAELLGGDHPFLLEVAADLHGLCRHADSGDFVISGWQPGCRPITFASENGAHGGPGCEETRGFVMLPPDLAGTRPYLRPGDLRRKIRWALEARLRKRAPRPGSLEENPSIRVVTYNVHSCLTLDGHLAPHRIARVLHNLRPDIVALQEVDQGMKRTRRQDQASIIARDLEMHHLFFPVLAVGRGHYGLAVLSRFPLHEVKYGFLSRGSAHAGRERRGFMWVEVEGPAGRLHLLNTHLGLTPAERRPQGEALLAALEPAGNRPMIVCADLNAGPRSPIYRSLTTRLTDAWMAGAVARPGVEPVTFPANYPFLRLDYIFVSSHFETVRAAIPDHHEAKKASDHLPMMADVRFRGEEG